ncbi:hypothetical protein MLD38_010394 [Melastoma candidum]|uniref:Uncharacterized protein n=1 Tax=Melastoma candidum TaxID=119954 RepID=A0ACB9QZU0_9MYRT|nr:hypothetical protein MLD38_010394 [Melastoma candidum]
MPGLVSVKTPPDAPPPPRISLPSPSPSSSRADPPLPSPPQETPFPFPLLCWPLQLARDAIAASSSVEGPAKALEYALRASRSFERALAANPGEEARLNHAMSLHVVAAVYCSLGRYEEGCRWSRGPWRPSRRTG